MLKLFRKQPNKTRRTSGETIAETLIALLISSLALVMLAGVISSSSNLVDKSRSTLDAYYTANEENGIIDQSGEGSGATITIKDTGYDGKLSDTAYSVTYYTNAKFSRTPVISYRINE